MDKGQQWVNEEPDDDALPTSIKLYHGTTHPFKVGDMITPQGDSPYAWSSASSDYAQEMVNDSFQHKWYDHLRENPNANLEEFSKNNTPRVYEVEHLGDARFHPYYSGTSIVSSTGFKVVKMHTTYPEDGIGKEWS